MLINYLVLVKINLFTRFKTFFFLLLLFWNYVIKWKTKNSIQLKKFWKTKKKKCNSYYIQAHK